ncbi:MAG: hypothetical protein AAGD32_05980 [Planctomycetota bacterium]
MQHDTTLIACIEAGPLEANTLRLFQSVRRHGGTLANAPAVAVIPRLGLPLSGRTRRMLDELDVDVVQCGTYRRYGWYHLLNKVVGLATLERTLKTDQLTFLDSDTLMCREGGGLLLREGADVAACCPDDGVVGSSREGDPYHPAWRQACEVLGVDVNELPMIPRCDGGPDICLYLNTGVFSYRRETQLANAWLGDCIKLLDAHVGFGRFGEHWLEQACFGLTLHRLGLKLTLLDESANYALRDADGCYTASGRVPADAVTMLHYHKAMHAAHWPRLLDLLEADWPQLASWLAPLGPVVADHRSLPTRMLGEGLRAVRGVPRKRWRTRAAKIATRSVGFDSGLYPRWAT